MKINLAFFVGVTLAASVAVTTQAQDPETSFAENPVEQTPNQSNETPVLIPLIYTVDEQYRLQHMELATVIFYT